ncbi:MAG: hypothetical protein M3521_12940 [Acidobacteriota bacterium]|jgi:hypothetical protein|nr:hypothetical protein [Acidobacteriota bacterium]MDQ3374778.1 hypothetical protein [Acidobacteriota bacterium]
MKDRLLEELKIDKTAFSVGSLEESDEKEYWLRQTPEARLRQMEILRRINYGHRATGRLQRFFEAAQQKGC